MGRSDDMVLVQLCKLVLDSTSIARLLRVLRHGFARLCLIGLAPGVQSAKSSHTGKPAQIVAEPQQVRLAECAGASYGTISSEHIMAREVQVVAQLAI